MLELEKVKESIQKILDKYIEPGSKFSIKNIDEETVYLLIDLLLEKDDLEREKIWAKFNEKIIEHQINLRVNFESIKEIKDVLDYQKIEITDLNSLKELVGIEQNMDQQLNNL